MKEVICIKEEWDIECACGLGHPKKNESYKVKEIFRNPFDSIDKTIYYELEEFPEHGYDSEHFADVTHIQDEIEKALKAPTPVKELEKEFEPAKENKNLYDNYKPTFLAWKKRL